jgi:hypothetical protein
MAARRGILVLLLLLASSPALAGQELGALRVATSSGTFLKIGISPQAAAMGGAWSAVAADAAAAWYNPAGLGQLANRQVYASYVAWPADIHYGNLILALPTPRLGGTLGVMFGSLSTTMDETDEYHPYGTGRSFGYADWVLGLSFARFMTDRLLLGLSLKYVREDLGSSVGGPVTNAWVVDAGTLYRIEYGNLRIGMSIQNFGPEFAPSGSYWNHVEEKTEEYESFPPPAAFKLGVAFEPWHRHPWLLTQTLEMNHLSDNAETLATGLELSYLGGLFAVRAGYDFMADEMGLSAGFGANFMLGGAMAGLDYAYTDGNSLGAIHRGAFRVDF